ncbi:MAG: tRNA 2-thiouridine(34) synthase MnmA [Bacilli bacterium]|nr:tRNA 2-thiouridine(34) synthase MnmA [Bacilli bacterium]
MKRVLIGLSGGVDSSTSIILLKKMGYEVVGVTFRFTEHFDETSAVEAAKKLEIEHHVLDYRKEFKEEVIDKFVSDYNNGLTPNPCVHCNRVCKFKYLFENMEKYNCDYIATGHYARIENGKLYRSSDRNKDQSYFLYGLPKDKLNKIIFPLEGLTKDKVREIAKENGLTNYNKKDSFDVCFITDSFRNFMKENSNNEPGDVINIENRKVIGQHIGLSNYTIGQRRGLNIGGFEDKMFVVGKDIKKNVLYISLGESNAYLMSTECLLDNINILGDEKMTECTAKFRYRGEEYPVKLEWIDNEILVKYPEGIKGVTPGQACVFYDDEECLGGGIIKEVRKDNEKLWYL